VVVTAKTMAGDGGGVDGGKVDGVNGCDGDSDGGGHRQQSTKTAAKETAVAAEMAEATSWRRRRHKAEAIVPVETIDAKVSAATT